MQDEIHLPITEKRQFAFGDSTSVTSPADIVTQLLASLASIKSVKKWYSGQPPASRTPGFPYGWVEWAGGIRDAPVYSRAETRDKFYIVVVCKHIDNEKAEAEALGYVKTLEDLIKAGPSIGGLVNFAWVSNREKEKLFDKDYSVVGVRVTVDSRRLS